MQEWRQRKDRTDVMDQPTLGHNGGPALKPGSSWARHCWTQARAQLLPTLPLEIIRLRVTRARAIGLDYSTYATIRATTGRDIVAVLFSSEALRIRPVTLDLPAAHAARLAAISADRVLLVAPDIDLGAIAGRFAVQGVRLAGIAPSPSPLGSWSDSRQAIRAALNPLRLPGDAVVLVGEGRLQRDWAEAGRLAAFLPASHFLLETLR